MIINEEKFAVVDIRDELLYFVIGKKALHNLGPEQYHRASHLFIEVTGGRFIIQLKAEGTENAGKWSSAVSGHVAANETYDEAVIREAKEELGLTIEAAELEKVAIIYPNDDTGQEFISLYTYLMDDKTECIKLNSDEIKEVRILKLDDVIKDVDSNPDTYSPAFKIALDVFLTQYKI